jgi:hypothetical protein
VPGSNFTVKLVVTDMCPELTAVDVSWACAKTTTQGAKADWDPPVGPSNGPTWVSFGSAKPEVRGYDGYVQFNWQVPAQGAECQLWSQA